jgi:rod shape-determining protein MreC
MRANVVPSSHQRERSPRRRIVLYALFVAGSLLLLAMGTSEQVRELRNGVQFAFSPVRTAMADGARSISSMFAAFTEIDQLRSERVALQARVQQLEQQLGQVEILRAENARLAELLGAQQALSFDTVAAFVIQGSPNQFERVITIDKGRDAGIEPYDGVLSPGGALLGVVTEVFDNLSTVRLISDTRSLVIGMDVNTRATGEVTGNLSLPLIMDKVPATQRLTESGAVVTAGQLVRNVPSMLPKDLLIGTIIDIHDDASQFQLRAEILPAADLDHPEGVLVITSYKPPQVFDPDATPDPEQPLPTAAPQPTRRRGGGGGGGGGG